jgi:DHA1 family tetracycline resistance protein-like MFS transporter
MWPTSRHPADRAKRFGMLGADVRHRFHPGAGDGRLLGEIDLRLPFFVAGGLALEPGLWLLRVARVLAAGAAAQLRLAARQSGVGAVGQLAQLKSVGPLVWVIALSSLAQFIVHSSWVLFTSFKFGWGPRDNGLSLFAVGFMSALVQGFLLPRMLKRFPTQKLAIWALAVQQPDLSRLGPGPQGWMLLALIVLNVFGYAAQASIQSIVSNAADATQPGRDHGRGVVAQQPDGGARRRSSARPC